MLTDSNGRAAFQYRGALAVLLESSWGWVPVLFISGLAFNFGRGAMSEQRHLLTVILYLFGVSTITAKAIYDFRTHILRKQIATIIIVIAVVILAGLFTWTRRETLAPTPPDLHGVLIPDTKPTPERADITAKFVYPDSIALVLMNYSQAPVRDPGYFMMLWNLDSPGRDPLPIPSQNFNGDRIIPNQEMVPLAIVTLKKVAPLVKKGDRLFGFVTVTCPDCLRPRSYYVYAVHGDRGWFTELPIGRNPDVNGLIQALPKIREDPESTFTNSGIPLSVRHPIGEYQGP
jgi:hypothetical protein